MFVGMRELVNGMDVHASFVSESASTNERLTAAKLQNGCLVDVTGEFREVIERSTAQHTVTCLFVLQVCHDGHQVSVSASFANAVDRPLDLIAPCIDCGQRVGRREITVVVTVNAKLNTERREDGTCIGDDSRDFFWQGSAVCVAKDDPLRPALAAAETAWSA